MNGPQFLKIDKDDYERIAKALVVYDHVRFRNSGTEGPASGEISELQERWLGEADRFGQSLSDEERDKLIDLAYDEIDEFVEAETWHELAWWLAERDCARLAEGSKDKESESLVTDRIYHEYMDEFDRRGVDEVRVAGLPKTDLTPKMVAEALVCIKADTKGIGVKKS